MFSRLGVTAEMVAGIIHGHATSRPRNRQKQIGPSGIGTPCTRRIGYQLLDVDPVNFSDPLAAWIGTAAHASMEAALADDKDWETEIPVTFPGYPIRGTADAYSASLSTVVDWKFVAPTSLRKYAANGPGEQYRTQAHMYGCGLNHSGRAVDTVAIAFIPRSGLLSGIHVWSEPYDDQVVEAALERYDLVGAVTTSGLSVLPQLGTKDAYCDWCPYFNPNSTDLTAACSGHKPPAVAGS